MHGGDTYGLDIVADLSANVNPLGMPPQMIEALEKGVRQCTAYPDPQCRDLRQAIAKRDGVTMSQVVCGNGAADLIFRFVQAMRPEKALLTAPTFGEYGQALQSVGCEIQQYMLSPDQDFALDAGFLERITPEIQVVFVCTPNNPTGQCVAPGLLEAIAQRCQAVGCYLVVDQCFLDLCQEPEPMLHLLGNPWVLLLRAFTKSYAMAGMRLGYCLSGNQEICEKLMAIAQPWSVSTLAQLGGVVACECPEWTAQGRGYIAQQRPKLMAALEAKGYRVWPGQANYLLFQAPGCTDLRETLLQQGVLIRSCANYPGLGADYYRIAIATAEQSQHLIQALERLL